MQPGSVLAQCLSSP